MGGQMSRRDRQTALSQADRVHEETEGANEWTSNRKSKGGLTGQ